MTSSGRWMLQTGGEPDKRLITTDKSAGLESKKPKFEEKQEDAGFFARRSITKKTKESVDKAMKYTVLSPLKTVKGNSFAIDSIDGNEMCLGTYANMDLDALPKDTPAIVGLGNVRYNDKRVKSQMIEAKVSSKAQAEDLKKELDASAESTERELSTELKLSIDLEKKKIDIERSKNGPRVYLVRGKGLYMLPHMQTGDDSGGLAHQVEKGDIIVALTPELFKALIRSGGFKEKGPDFPSNENILADQLFYMVNKSKKQGDFDSMEFAFEIQEALSKEGKGMPDTKKGFRSGSYFAFQIP